jgi:hypothetical protein
MEPTSWASASRSNSPVAPVTVSKAADTTTNAAVLRARAALPIACKSLDSPMIPAGRSVKALASFSADAVWIRNALLTFWNGHALGPHGLTHPPSWFRSGLIPLPTMVNSWSPLFAQACDLRCCSGPAVTPQCPRHFPGLCGRDHGLVEGFQAGISPRRFSQSFGTLGFTGLDWLFSRTSPTSTPGRRLTWTLALGSERLRPAIRT